MDDIVCCMQKSSVNSSTRNAYPVSFLWHKQIHSSTKISQQYQSIYILLLGTTPNCADLCKESFTAAKFGAQVLSVYYVCKAICLHKI